MGFQEFPIFKSLIPPQLIFGMPRKLFVAVITATVAIVFSLGQLWFIPVAVILVIIFSAMSKQDPYFFDISSALIKLPKVMD